MTAVQFDRPIERAAMCPKREGNPRIFQISIAVNLRTDDPDTAMRYPCRSVRVCAKPRNPIAPDSPFGFLEKVAISFLAAFRRFKELSLGWQRILSSKVPCGQFQQR